MKIRSVESKKDRRRREEQNRKARAFRRLKLRRARNRLPGLAPSEISAVEVGRFAQTPAACSCLGCSNPRKRFKGHKQISLTFQERRELLKERQPD
jgi:hypothetical protein